nr:hypothetical protein [Tanacetum cinerariifolium]
LDKVGDAGAEHGLHLAVKLHPREPQTVRDVIDAELGARQVSLHNGREVGQKLLVGSLRRTHRGSGRAELAAEVLALPLP